MKKILQKRWSVEEQGNESASSSTAPLLIGINICTICLFDLGIDNVSTSCGHKFHKTCLMKWLLENNVCPVCRTNNPFPTGFQEERERQRAERERRRTEIIASLAVLNSTGPQPGRLSEYINTVQDQYNELTTLDSYESDGGSLRKYMSNRSQKMRRHKKSKSHKKRRIGKRTKRRRY